MELDEQKQTILAGLRKEEKKLVDEINACRPTPSGVLFRGGAITICEDEDDWKVITMGSRLKLKRVREEIARLS
ncbi:hypothetical protein ES703_47192 [subsurface metagenome]